MIDSQRMRRVACLVAAGMALPLLAQSFPNPPSLRAWAMTRLDQRRPQAQKGQPPTVREALDLLAGGSTSGETRRVALSLLAQRPAQEWAEQALKRAGYLPDVALVALAKGYRSPGPDPTSYLGDAQRLGRPWLCGLGLHLDGEGAWRFQVIPHPALMSRIDAPAALPKGLEAAAQPTALIHLKQLRPGLQRLKDVAGGEGGLGATLMHGSRAGFLLRHVEAWLAQGSAALEPLATREAWILHYGVAPRRWESAGISGSLVFVPGELPTRTDLALGLLRLNPFAKGVRSRTETWAGEKVVQVRGAGGVLHLLSRPEGTWISDREAPLRALLSPEQLPTLAERSEWTKVALAGRAATTQVSLWTLPALGVDASFEVAAHRRRAVNAQQGVWPNPFIAKAAPRTGAFALALGAGPTEVMLRSFLRVDDAFEVEDPSMPAFAEGGKVLTPAQRKAYEAAVAKARVRREKKQALRDLVTALEKQLDLRGSALVGGGFVPAPALTDAQKATLATYRRLQKSDPEAARKMSWDGSLSFFGPASEPGMTPSLALALPVRAGQEAQVTALLDRLWPMLFRGTAQKKALGAAQLRRVRTGQAFNPCFTVAKGHLVLGTEEGPVASVVAGLEGQAPTLADKPGQAYGRMEMDGERLAKDLETLLVAYLRSREDGYRDWFERAATSEDVAAEVASTFGPFLGAVKGLGRRSLDLVWTAGGLELRPQ